MGYGKQTGIKMEKAGKRSGVIGHGENVSNFLSYPLHGPLPMTYDPSPITYDPSFILYSPSPGKISRNNRFPTRA